MGLCDTPCAGVLAMFSTSKPTDNGKRRDVNIVRGLTGTKSLNESRNQGFSFEFGYSGPFTTSLH